ncbi:MAG TPA: alpha/beta fold hydrolase, partial [Labilithrix sp.]
RHANVMAIPFGGDVFLRDAKGQLARLTKTPEPEIDATLCDTGERIAYVRKDELFAMDVATKKETQLTTGATDGLTHGLTDFIAQEEFDESSGFRWSPKCDRLAYFEVDERKVEKVPVLGWRQGKAILAEQRYPETGKTNPSARLGVVDLATKRTIWVKWPDAQERYVLHVQWSDDGKSLFAQALTRDQKRRSLVRIDPQTGAVREITSETHPAWVEPQEVFVLASGDLLTTTDASGHHHLEVRSGKDGAILRTLTKGDWDVAGVLAVDEERSRVLFGGTKDGVLFRHLYSVPLGGGDITRITNEPGVHGVRSDEHGRAFVDLHSAHDRLPRADVYEEGKLVGELPIVRDADLGTLDVRPMEFVTLRGAAGDELHGALLRPRNVAAGEKHPAVVYVYGGPGPQMVIDHWSANLLFQHFADRGFFVFELDGRGSGGRGIAWEQKLHDHFGTVELEDQIAGARWLAQLPEVDASRIGIFGHSYGGFLAAAAMLKTPGAFAAGASGSPVTDWRLYDTGYTERYMGTPTSNPDGYAAAELPRFASSLAGPLLILHGNMDENVHYTNTARLVDALVAADKRFDLLVLPGERHSVRDAAARAYANERIVTFFAERLR